MPKWGFSYKYLDPVLIDAVWTETKDLSISILKKRTNVGNKEPDKEKHENEPMPHLYMCVQDSFKTTKVIS